MKKIYSLVIGSVLLFSLTACGNNGSVSSETNQSTAVSAETLQTDQETADSAETLQTDQETADSEETQVQDIGEGKSLVIYFSGTGHTRAMAESLADIQEAEIYEIVPEQPYTQEDLNYNDDNCRANVEMNDENARPAIAGEPIELEDYETLYIGFPIWWGTMPKIINTFLDTYDLSGKVIAPFCTSGGSGISQAVSAIRAAEPDADVKDGLQISSSAASDCTEQLTGWLEEIGL